MEKMRGELAAMEEKRKLAHVTGIVEERVLNNLVQAGVTGRNADRRDADAAGGGRLVRRHRFARGARRRSQRGRRQGIKPDSAAYGLLKSWLEQRPDPQIIAAWKDYVSDVSSQMPTDSVGCDEKTMLDRVTKVAVRRRRLFGPGDDLQARRRPRSTSWPRRGTR